MRIFRLTLIMLLMCSPAIAQSDKPERLAVEAYHFAYTFDTGSVVTYSQGSNGATGICFPKGGKTTDEPLYRVLVYGKDSYLVSLAEARDSGIDPPQEQFLQAAAFPTDIDWNDQFTKIMSTHERSISGQASIRLPGGKTRIVPYFAWDRTIGGRTHYALMYVTIHNGAFIAVQVEGSKPFSEAALKSLTTGLELTEPPAAPASAAS